MTISQITITESGMTFGPYNSAQCFHIEKSNLYASISRNNGVKMAEFLLIRDTPNQLKLCIVEAKSSTPHPDNDEKVDVFVGEVRDKFVNALSLCCAAYLQRHARFYEELPLQIHVSNL